MDIRTVGIVGTGVMGLGIARAAALAGYPVTIVKWTRRTTLVETQDAFEATLRKDADRGKLEAGAVADIRARLTWADSPSSLSDCDLVIESIVEDYDAKLECFLALEANARADAILASNTSTLSIRELAEATKRPGLVLGTHFFNPVSEMELVEVPVPEAVEAEAVEAVLGFARKLGKQPFVVKDSPGFVVNRLLMSSPLEAIRMAFEERPRVADLETIDACIRLGLRHPMGPFRLMDLIGLDVMYGMAVSLQEDLRKEQFCPPRLLEHMIDRGWLGRKSGTGFYDYSDRKNPRPNPGLEKLASED